MKISKQIWIEDGIKWNSLRKRELCKRNRYKGHAYIVCTSPRDHLLFEIVEARLLNGYYQDAMVLALCMSKKQAVSEVTKWVDALYNQQIITYDQLGY